MNKHIDITAVVLTTPRLTLRAWEESDLHDFSSMQVWTVSVRWPAGILTEVWKNPK